MGRYGFVGVGAAATNAIQQHMLQRELQKRQAILEQLAQQDQERQRAIQERQIALQEENTRRNTERQARIDQQAENDRDRQIREEQNDVGVRNMIADALTQGDVTPDARKTIGIMAYREGMPVPGVLQPPNRTVVATVDAQGRRIRRAVTDEELAAGVPEYEESDAGFTLGTGDVRYDNKGNVIARGRDRDTGPTDNPALPRGVQDYIASMKGRGYDRARAEAEIFGAETWNKIRGAHPRIEAVEVQQALARFFPTNDLLGGGIGDDTASEVPPSPQSVGGRTASQADVAAVAQRLGVSTAEAQRQLEARGVAIR